MDWPATVNTGRLVLRRPVDADASAIFDGYAQDPDAVRYLTWRPHTGIDQTHAFLADCRAGWDRQSHLTWALTLVGDDRLIGMIAVRPHAFKPDLGYALAKPYWGNGFMTEAGRAIVRVAFANPAVHRVWAVCDVDNRGSARVLEKLGMTREGVLHRWTIHPNVSDEPRDSYCYARVRAATPQPAPLPPPQPPQRRS
jgi:[ribosomal protein S5]-alanine N-acetyltransferase